jgi:hypothetical protein
VDPTNGEYTYILDLYKAKVKAGESLLSHKQAGLKEMETKAANLARDGHFESAGAVQDAANVLEKGVKETSAIVNVAKKVKKDAGLGMHAHNVVKSYRLQGQWTEIYEAARWVLHEDPPTSAASTSVEDVADDDSEEEDPPAEPDSEEPTIQLWDGSTAPLASLEQTKLHKNERKKADRKGTTLEKPVGKKKSGGTGYHNLPTTEPTTVIENMLKDALAKKWSCTLGTTKHEGSNKHGHTLRLKDNHTFCLCCKKYIGYYKIGQHICSTSHLGRLKKHQNEETKQQTIASTRGIMLEKGLVGQTNADEVLRYKCRLVLGACAANIPANTFASFILTSEEFARPGLNFGNPRDTFDVVICILSEQIPKKNREFLTKKCRKEFATITDGAPGFAKVEGMMVVAVTKAWEIIKTLTTFKLYEGSMNKDRLMSHLLNSVRVDAELDPEDWLDATQDGLATNGAAIDKIERDTAYSPSKTTCGSHTLCRSGIHFDTPTLDMWTTAWNRCIQYRGKLTDKFNATFGEAPISGTGPCWYVKNDSHGQVLAFHPENIISKVVEDGILNAYSFKSCKKVNNIFSPKGIGGNETMARLLLELASSVDGGSPLAVGTYQLEGSDPLILSAWTIFRQLDEKIGAGLPLPNVDKELPRVKELLAMAKEPYVSVISMAEQEVEIAEHIATVYSQELQDIQQSESQRISDIRYQIHWISGFGFRGHFRSFSSARPTPVVSREC